MNQFLSVKDVADVNDLVQKVRAIKTKNTRGDSFASGKTVVLLFFNPSLRTRISTEKAANNLGMKVITMNTGHGWELEVEDGAVMNLSKAEHVKEAALVISQYADIIGVRTFAKLSDRDQDYAETMLLQFAKYATVPVLSLESATLHPLQSLADMVTIAEHRKAKQPKVVLTWTPHPRALPQAVANSFIEWAKTTDNELVVTYPEGADLAPQFTENTIIEHDQKKALEGADFVYAKNWSSFSDYGKIISPKENWMVTPEKMALTNQAKFMHCLPVRRNVVVSDAVLDGPNSLHIEQAANREYAAQAVLQELIGGIHKS